MVPKCPGVMPRGLALPVFTQKARLAPQCTELLWTFRKRFRQCVSVNVLILDSHAQTVGDAIGVAVDVTTNRMHCVHGAFESGPCLLAGNVLHSAGIVPNRRYQGLNLFGRRFDTLAVLPRLSGGTITVLTYGSAERRRSLARWIRGKGNGDTVMIDASLRQFPALGKGVHIVERRLLCPRPAHAGGEHLHILHLIASGIKPYAVSMAGHRHIGQMPVNRCRSHDEGAIDGCTLRLVNGRRIAMVKGLVTIDGYG